LVDEGEVEFVLGDVSLPFGCSCTRPGLSGLPMVSALVTVSWISPGVSGVVGEIGFSLPAIQMFPVFGGKDGELVFWTEPLEIGGRIPLN
jgi:hypothetical protein